MYYYAVNNDGLHAFPTLEDRTRFCGKVTHARECNLDGRYKNVLYWDHMQCAALKQFGLVYLLNQVMLDTMCHFNQCTLNSLNKWLAEREHDYINNYNSRVTWLEYIDLYIGYYMSARYDCAQSGHKLTFKSWFDNPGYAHNTIHVVSQHISEN